MRNGDFNRKQFWNSAAFALNLPQILGLFALTALIITLTVRRVAPDLFLILPRTRPVLWGMVMVFYPILSVYPQGIIYRAFLVERYGDLIPNRWLLMLASAVVFAYVHIIFRNSLAVGLTFLGGLLFAFRYLQTGSLLVSSFEHALYGCLMFTVGLGRSFYRGTV